MTEIRQDNLATGNRNSVKGWVRGIFRIRLIDALSVNDNSAAVSTLTTGHDAQLAAGYHTNRALVQGQGYIEKRGGFEKPVPKAGGEEFQVASLDIYEDGVTAVYTEERESPIREAVRTATVQGSSTQALSSPVRLFDVWVFSRRTAAELKLDQLVSENSGADSGEVIPFPVSKENTQHAA